MESYGSQAILAAIGDGVIVTNYIGTIVFINAAAEHITGWSGSESFFSRSGTLTRLTHVQLAIK